PMTRRRAIWSLTLLLLGVSALVLPRAGSGHEFTLESLMNGFVTMEAREAHLVIRVPLHVIKAARFPTVGREIDLANADAAIGRALAQIAREMTISEDG